MSRKAQGSTRTDLVFGRWKDVPTYDLTEDRTCDETYDQHMVTSYLQNKMIN